MASLLSRSSASPAPAATRLYGMQERAQHLDFDMRFEGARDTLSQPHQHEYFQIQVSLDGGTQQHIGAAVRPFTRGHVSFVRPFCLHVVPHPPGARYAILNFDRRFLWPDWDSDAPATPTPAQLRKRPELAPFVYQEHADFAFDAAHFAQVTTWIDTMAERNTARAPGALAEIRGLLLQLLGLTCRLFDGALQTAAAVHAAQEPAHEAVRLALQHMRAHLALPLSITATAQAAGISRHHLAHQLQAQTGRSFTQWLTTLRLEQAQALLRDTPLPVRDVAHRCGFDDEAYFSRRFRQTTGMAPRVWRDQQRA